MFKPSNKSPWFIPDFVPISFEPRNSMRLILWRSEASDWLLILDDFNKNKPSVKCKNKVTIIVPLENDKVADFA